MAGRKFTQADYQIGWICALPTIEYPAAISMLDQEHEPLDFDVTYQFGRIGRHNVVIACLPEKGSGVAAAAGLAGRMLSSFPNLRFALMVGIGGGVPTRHDVRLGDVVVGTPDDHFGGVVQYNRGKDRHDKFELTGHLNAPPLVLRHAVAFLQSQEKLYERHEILKYIEGSRLPPHFRTRGHFDILFSPEYLHTTGQPCDLHNAPDKEVKRETRPNSEPRIFYGLVASGDLVMKNALSRDQIANEIAKSNNGSDILCFETEAAGLVINLDCLVIRGISDYCDSHKNDDWHRYAAATAAAYAKWLLNAIAPREVTSEQSNASRQNSLIAQTPSKPTSNHENLIQICDDRIPEIRTLSDALNTLDFPELDHRQQDIKQAYIDSCEWILGHDSYLQWSRNGRGILGIRGKPGSGKSTLLKRIFQTSNNKNSQDEVRLAFFFHRRGVDLQHTVLGMFRTLLYQLLNQVPSVGASFITLYEDKRKWQGESLKDWNWRVAELRPVFSSALIAAAEQYKIWIFVDALDEASVDDSIDFGDEDSDHVAQDIVIFLQELNQQLLSADAMTNICFSCRHLPVLAINHGFEVCLEDNNQNDISMYTAAELEKRLVSPEKGVLSKLHAEIVNRASGVFMWAAAVILVLAKQHNKGRSFEEIQKYLSLVPSSLAGIYAHILTKVVDVEDRPRTLLLMQWILFAQLPLSVTEVRFALASDDASINPDQKSCKLSENFINSDAEMEKQIRSLTGGLAEIKLHSHKDGSLRRTVQYIHQSIREFLIKDQFKCLGENIINFNGQGHHRLARSCINYLQFEETVEQAKMKNHTEMRHTPFIEYAADYWFIHAEKAEEDGVLQINLVQKLGWPSFTTLRDWFNVYRAFHGIHGHYSRWNPGCSLIHIAAGSNLKSVLLEILDRGCSVELRDKDCNTAMHYAARHGHDQIMGILFNAGANKSASNTSRDTPLSNAAKAGHEAIVQMLLDLGENVNNATGGSLNALQDAAGSRHVSLVRLLLKMGADVNAKGGRYGNALQTAIHSESERTVQLLMKSGADVNAQGGYYGNALQAAAYKGWRAVVQLLLESGADVNAQGGYYGNALQAAALSGSLRNVQLLLESGANANTQGGHYGNALQAAVSAVFKRALHLMLGSGADGNAPAYSESEGIAQLLLKSGADVNARGGHYGNALQAAAHKGSNRTVPLLLESGADINARGGHYGNALQAAASAGSERDVRLLLESGADVNAPGGHYGHVLPAAVSSESEAMVQLLLESGANINAQRPYFGSSLYNAVLQGSDAIVQLLLKSGADVNVQGGQYGNALQVAALRGPGGMVQVVLESGADVNVQDENYSNMLQAAALRRPLAMMVQLLLKSGADVNAQGGYYGNALQAAAYKGWRAVVQLLLESGAHVNGQGGHYGNALQAAADQGSEDTVQLLLESGADVNAQGGRYGNALQAAAYCDAETFLQHLHEGGENMNEQGRYFGIPIRVAASSAQEAIVKLLLKSGADVNAQGGYYGNALQAAAFRGSLAVVQLLLKSGADIEATNSDGDTTMWVAVRGLSRAADHDDGDACDRYMNILELLLKRDAKISSHDDTYSDASWYADCQREHFHKTYDENGMIRRRNSV